MRKIKILTLLVICMLLSNIVYATDKGNGTVNNNPERTEEIVDLSDTTFYSSDAASPNKNDDLIVYTDETIQTTIN